MDPEKEEVSLQTMAGGAVEEAFRAEFQRVLENILDPNTSATATRSISLKMTIKPSEDRSLGEVDVKCSASLVGSKPMASRLFIGRQNGRATAVEHDPKQPGLFKTEAPTPLKGLAGGKES